NTAATWVYTWISRPNQARMNFTALFLNLVEMTCLMRNHFLLLRVRPKGPCISISLAWKSTDLFPYRRFTKEDTTPCLLLLMKVCNKSRDNRNYTHSCTKLISWITYHPD